MLPAVEIDIDDDFEQDKDTKQRDRRAQRHNGKPSGNDGHMEQDDAPVGLGHEFLQRQ